jgi:Uma2 family endonuclease
VRNMTSHTNTRRTHLFLTWADTDGSGLLFDSSGGFVLPNGARRSPDISRVRCTRWEALAHEQQSSFPPLCPDFVLELRSPSDRLTAPQEKMAEYRDNGARLGWLLDPLERTVYIYRPGHAVERLDDPETLSGEPILPGFVLLRRQVWGSQ